jgi:hypothetical protein
MVHPLLRRPSSTPRFELLENLLPFFGQICEVRIGTLLTGAARPLTCLGREIYARKSRRSSVCLVLIYNLALDLTRDQ